MLFVSFLVSEQFFSFVQEKKCADKLDEAKSLDFNTKIVFLLYFHC